MAVPWLWPVMALSCRYLYHSRVGTGRKVGTDVGLGRVDDTGVHLTTGVGLPGAGVGTLITIGFWGITMYIIAAITMTMHKQMISKAILASLSSFAADMVSPH